MVSNETLYRCSRWNVRHEGGKLGIVEDIYDLLSAQQSIIFVNTRKEVHRIAALLREKGFSTEDLTGGRGDTGATRVVQRQRLAQLRIA